MLPSDFVNLVMSKNLDCMEDSFHAYYTGYRPALFLLVYMKSGGINEWSTSEIILPGVSTCAVGSMSTCHVRNRYIHGRLLPYQFHVSSPGALINQPRCGWGRQVLRGSSFRSCERTTMLRDYENSKLQYNWTAATPWLCSLMQSRRRMNFGRANHHDHKWWVTTA